MGRVALRVRLALLVADHPARRRADSPAATRQTIRPCAPAHPLWHTHGDRQPGTACDAQRLYAQASLSRGRAKEASAAGSHQHARIPGDKVDRALLLETGRSIAAALSHDRTGRCIAGRSQPEETRTQQEQHTLPTRVEPPGRRREFPARSGSQADRGERADGRGDAGANDPGVRRDARSPAIRRSRGSGDRVARSHRALPSALLMGDELKGERDAEQQAGAGQEDATTLRIIRRLRPKSCGYRAVSRGSDRCSGQLPDIARCPSSGARDRPEGHGQNAEGEAVNGWTPERGSMKQRGVALSERVEGHGCGFQDPRCESHASQPTSWNRDRAPLLDNSRSAHQARLACACKRDWYASAPSTQVFGTTGPLRSHGAC